MRLKKYLGLAALTGMLLGCGGGNSANTSPGLDVPTEVLATPASAMVEVSGATTGQKVTVSYGVAIEPQEAEKLQWQLSFEGTTLPISVSAGNLSAEFTPALSGMYELVVLREGTALRKIPVIVNADIPYAPAMVEKIEGIGEQIANQFVFSSKLSRSETTSTVAKYQKLTLLDMGAHGRFTIQLDHLDDASLTEFESLKLEAGIRFVDNRIVNRTQTTFYTPNDGSRFDDHGDNWHLEDIGMVTAWDYTKGSDKVLIGVVDGGIYQFHKELESRILTIVNNQSGSTTETIATKEHGTGAASTIVGNANNGIGISGINQRSKIRFDTHSYKYSSGSTALEPSWNIISGCAQDAKVASHSWGNYGKTKAEIAKYWGDAREVIRERRDSCLVVLAAGNSGGKTEYGSGDALYANGILQYESGDLNTVSPLDNLIVVGAYIRSSATSDRVLAIYSSFGESVEIAAPTEFKAAKRSATSASEPETYHVAGTTPYGQSSQDQAFNGTSAATPVVSGVASLIFSLAPDYFAPADVKRILIESAKKNGYITHREITAGGETEILAHPIPVLNAAAALKMAQDELDARVVQSTAKIEQPSSGRMVLNLKVANGVIQSGSGTIAASATGCLSPATNPNSNYSGSFAVDGNGTAQLPLTNTGVQCYKISGNANIRVPSGETLSRPFELFKQVQTVRVNAKDQADLKVVPQASVSIDGFTGQTLTDTQGTAWLWLEPGINKMFVAKPAYKPFAQNLFVNSGIVDAAIGFQSIDTYLTADAIQSAGALVGVVSEASGKPISNATVRISGGDQTNGFFASAVTNGKGEYSISNISLIDSTGKPIPSFLMIAFTTGYKASLRTKVVVLDGKTRNESFVLQTDPDAASKLVYSQGFEGSNDWVLTGLWNRTLHTQNSIRNTLVDGGFSSLPPDELEPFAFLPAARLGNGALWYGAASTGSFIGTQLASDGVRSGGTSVGPNTGAATSASISLATTTNPLLRFWTWWEIEGVNPNSDGFDHMDIQVSSNGGVSYTTVRRLNPSVDPNDADRRSKNFSSGGFNRRPVWTFEEVDLSAYAGQSVRIRFLFNTNDSQYNGFRGWLIDDVKIEEQ